MGLKYFIWGYRNIIFCLAKIGYEKVFNNNINQIVTFKSCRASDNFNKVEYLPSCAAVRVFTFSGGEYWSLKFNQNIQVMYVLNFE
jgi:hypothetical protein